MAYKLPKPNWKAAANGNANEMFLTLQYLHERLDELEKKTGSGTFDSDKKTQVTKPPEQAEVAVSSPTSGHIEVKITNPEYRRLFSGSKTANPLKTPVLHQLEISTSPDFVGTVTTMPVSPQNHYFIPNGGQKVYVRVRSSYDGRNFNEHQVRAVENGA